MLSSLSSFVAQSCRGPTVGFGTNWRCERQQGAGRRGALEARKEVVAVGRGRSPLGRKSLMAPRDGPSGGRRFQMSVPARTDTLWDVESSVLPGLNEEAGLLQRSPEMELEGMGLTPRSQRREHKQAAEQEPPSLLVFSGGTAFNGVVEDLKDWTTKVAHVLPVSDDGGSTAEIVRVLGGPAVGDIRSRCLRLSDGSNAEALAVKRLLRHRLPMDATAAKLEWYQIVEGEHELWEGVSPPYKDTIRAFLVHFQGQILRHSTQRFCFENGSVGNFFFAGARTFFRSMEAAIFLYSRVSHIPADSLVLPVVCTNQRLVLGAELQDGSLIRGQHEISHPTLDSSCRSLWVNKDYQGPSLSSPIKRIFYMAVEGTHLLHEVFPEINPRVLEQLGQVDGIMYGMGSLYTSICPCLVLRGTGEAIAARNCPKVLLLNGAHDRETAGMSAADFVAAICNALNRTYGEDEAHRLQNRASAYVTVLVAPRGGQIPIDSDRLLAMGISNIVMVDSEPAEKAGAYYKPAALISAVRRVVMIRSSASSEEL